jgi:hypothetical protein
MTLLAEIRSDAVNSKVALADLLRKCKVLAARLKNKEFADWVNHELSGYPRGTAVPPYRQLRTPHSIGHFSGPLGSGAKNVPLPLLGLPLEIRDSLTNYWVLEPVKQLEEFAANDTKGLALPWPADTVSYVATNHPMLEGLSLMAASRHLSPGTVSGVVDNIRSRILDFVLAIEAENPNAGEAPLNAAAPVAPATVSYVYNTTIVGGQAIVGNSGEASIGSGNVAAGTATSGGPTEPAELLPLLKQLREEAERTADEENRKDAVEIVDKMEKHASGPKAKFDPERMLKYVSLYSSVATAASQTLPQLEHALMYLRHALGG